MATKSLISITDLLEQSWAQVREHAAELSKRSSWFIALAVGSFALNLLAFALPDYASPALRIIDWAGIQLLGTSFVSMRVTQALIRQETNNTEADVYSSKIFFAYVWVSILVGLASLGGLVVFVIPGVWLTVALSFALLYVLEERKRGTQAMAASVELVKGRWWATMIRLAVPGLAVLFLFFFVTSLLNSIVTFIAGYNPTEIVREYAAAYWWVSPPKQIVFAAATNQAIGALSMALFAPMVIALITRLFHELKRTK
ncbi:hypothetical protein KBA73_05200 [Patescibacteria group bacterium]|nr:hypothetical protein [Patescibacteria group bacterium]